MIRVTAVLAAFLSLASQLALADELEDARSVHRGGLVFLHYCANCHGITADGNGRAAKLYNPRPANLQKSDKNDAYKELIIRRGGGALGRSAFMPPWGEELTNEQIRDVVTFLHSIQERKPKK